MDDLAAADAVLDEYLAENAAARGVEFSGQVGSDTPDEWQEADWTIRPPLPADQPVLRRIFEDPFFDAHNQEVLLIHPVGTDDIRGAVKLSLGDNVGRNIKLALRIRGRTGDRWQGEEQAFITTRLLRAALVRAAAGGAETVTFSFPDDEYEAALARCLESLGFATLLTQTTYTMDMAEFGNRCLRLFERYKLRKAIPEDVRLVSMEEVSYGQIDEFLRQWFFDGAGAPEHELCPHLCRVMLKGDKIIGCYIGRKKDPQTFLVTRLGVLEEFRGLWVTAWLLGDGSKAGCDDGHTVIQFCTDEEKYPDFVRIARHMNAERGKTMLRMGLEFAIPWPREPRPTGPA